MGWTRGPSIGRGSTATVSIAASESGSILAVKSIELPKSHLLQRERNILSSISSPHVVSYIGCDISIEHNHLLYNIFMEYVPGGTLADTIRAHGRLPEPAIGAYTRHILLGLEYLHSIGIVHCDVKASNILISSLGPKIADLGCARNASPVEGEARVMAGTPLFMAPEVARGEEQGCAADIWSLGCTVIEMATGKSPWDAGDGRDDYDRSSGGDMGPFSLVYRIAYSDESVPEFPSWLSEEARDFLTKCLRRDPKERWTAHQLLDHCFVNKFASRDLDHHDDIRDYLVQEKLKTCDDRDVEEKMEKNKNYSSSSCSSSCCCDYYSPTSIVDQGIWCSRDGEAEEMQMMDEQGSWINKPPNERIRELCETQSKELVVDWGDGDDWFVIRG